MKNYVMIHDENLCIGCQACSVACRNENNVPSGLFRVQVRSNLSGEYPNLKLDFQRFSCVMCEDAPCIEVCPTKASFKTADGVTLIDQNLCVSCKYCILACPYDARFVLPDGQISKCTFCYTNRVSKGKEPACVEVCPTDALIFGDSKDQNSQISKIFKTQNIEFQKESFNTKPNLGIIKNYKGGAR